MKILIVYGTRYGTAAEIAEEIGKTIKNRGIQVEVIDAKKVAKDHDLSPFDMIIVGSGIKMGKWTKEALKFLKDNKKTLSTRKVALFVTCGDANFEETRNRAWENYLRKVAEENLENEPVSMGLFGSVYDPNAKHGLVYKLAMLLYKSAMKSQLDKMGIDTSEKVDFRDWDEIREWANRLVDMLH